MLSLAEMRPMNMYTSGSMHFRQLRDLDYALFGMHQHLLASRHSLVLALNLRPGHTAFQCISECARQDCLPIADWPSTSASISTKRAPVEAARYVVRSDKQLRGSLPTLLHL